MDIKIYIFIGLITLLSTDVNARSIKKINSYFHREYDMHDEYLARKESLKISHADLKSEATCEDGDCKNGGTCTDDDDGNKFCKCKEGISGDFCETVAACNVEKFKYCKGENGTCVLSDNPDEAKCECSGEKKFDDTINVCRATCEDGDCKNGGTCAADSSGTKFCKCRDGSYGDLCENVPACKDYRFKYCKEPNGICVLGDKPNEGKCECSDEKKFDEIYNSCRDQCGKDEDCDSGATCNSNKFCTCLKGTDGDKCEKVYDCLEGKYKNCNGERGSCTFDKEQAICTCKEYKKLDPSLGYCRDQCKEGESCYNGATCKNKFCTCHKGTYGDKCEKVYDCLEGKYKNCNGERGACAFDEKQKKATCTCEEDKKFDPSLGYCRDQCDEDEDCDSGATCNNKFCTCLKGTDGDKCEKVYDCLEGKYKNCNGERGSCAFDEEQKKATCTCEGDKKFDPSLGYCRETCEDDTDCKNGAVCTDDVKGAKFCKCRSGSRGDTCEIVPACDNPKFRKCKGDIGTCVLDETHGARCDCSGEKEFDGLINECRGKCGEDKKCQNGAVCNGANFCECIPGFKGDFCEIITSCDNPKFKNCKEGNGTCVVDDVDGAKCDCKGGKKFDDQINECRGTCEDDENCKNGAVCTADSSGAKFCKCKTGTTGDLCETATACNKPKFKNCTGDIGTCVFDDTNGARCECRGEKKFDDRINDCTGTCDEDRKCQNGGVCTADSKGIKFCRCKSGSRGDFCQIITSCDNPKFRNCKGENGTCAVDSMKVAGCYCKAGKKFDDQSNQCRGMCDEDGKCQNGGVCTADRKGKKFCRCKSGSSGDFCQIIASCNNPKFRNCKGENGTCVVDDTDGAKCNCKGGKKFDDQINECRDLCTKNPCQNGGTCLLSGSTFKCICKENFSGDKCESRAVTTSFILQLAIFALLIVIFIVHILSLVFKRCG